MKNLSLKWKIYLIGFIPFMFFLLSMFMIITDNLNSYKEIESLKSKITVIEHMNAVINETQKERGKSAGYLNGGVELNSLKEQRSANDIEINKLKIITKSSTFDEEYKNEILNQMAKISLLREEITDKKVELSLAVKSYSKIINTLLNIYLDVANNSQFPTIVAKLRSFRILEDAKESGGKLRANLTGILAKNNPISDEILSVIVGLKAGLDNNIHSSGLVLDNKSKEFIAEFETSKKWIKVNETFQYVLKKSTQGEFNKNSEEFFTDITMALDILGALIIYQKNSLSNEVNEIEAKTFEMLWQISCIIFAISILLFGFVSKMVNKINSKLKVIISTLQQSSEEVLKSSEEMSVTSSQLSEASSEQASSLQETVSSIDEISSMVQSNAEGANQSAAVSEKSKIDAVSGKDNIDKMISSIEDIGSSNQEIMNEVQRNNEEISEITRVITEIGEKTKVINDIVFQTKLLSFNASVEAARAGENGKGFAVVAEEIGSLATMSGQASQEISKLLDSSIKKVNEIVEKSKSKMDKLVTESKSKIDHGTDIAHKCGTSLENILKNVNEVNEMVKEISVASAEQASGVNEITAAMQQLDQVTHQNTTTSQVSASLAAQLKGSSEHLIEAVNKLIEINEGINRKDKNDKSLSAENSNILNLKFSKNKKSQELKYNYQDKITSGSDIIVSNSDDDPRFEDL